MPQIRELTVKMTMQAIKNRLRPKRLTSHPLMGRTMAFETRYDVSTHVLWSWPGAQVPRNVWKGHVGDAGVEHFHECRQ